MKAAIYIGLGGFLGALSRHGLAVLVGKTQGGFNIGILAVNVIGCFAFGLLFAVLDASGTFGKEFRLFVLTGFLGAFTTFSTFGFDTVSHLRSGQAGQAIANVALSVGLGVLAVWAGLAVASLLTGKS